MIDEQISEEQKQTEDENEAPDTNEGAGDDGNDTGTIDLDGGGETETADPGDSGETEAMDPGDSGETETVDLGEEGEFDEEEMPDISQLLPPTDVMSLSQLFISMLANSAWQYLGLIPDPKTNKIGKDIKQAGQAIDIIEFIHGKMKDDMDKEFVSGVDDLLANLRINFVKKSGEE